MALIPNLSGITSSVDALSNILLVTPKAIIGYNPQNAPTKNGTTPALRPALVFHYEGEQAVTLESDVTDHYSEDNTTLQDQIALKPETITTTGFIGELNDIVPEVLKPLKLIADKLGPISAYTPALSVTALNALNEAAFLYATASKAADAAVSAWSSLGTAVGAGSANTIIGSDGVSAVASVQNKQQQYFQQFYGYWRSRTLFTVQTPWAVFDNMALMGVRAVQNEETNVISDFELRFKKIRFASTTLTTGTGLNNQFMQGRASTQGSPKVNFGVSTPPLFPTSQADSISAIRGN
jgi:hypothetical protein